VHRQYFKLTGFVPESAIFSSLQLFRLLVSPFLEGLVQYMSLSADPQALLACLRFSSAKIVEFVSFTGAFTSQYVVKPVKETCETVHSIPKETCQKVTRFDEPYKTACFWGVNEISKDGHVYDLGLCKFVEYFQRPTQDACHRREGLITIVY